MTDGAATDVDAILAEAVKRLRETFSPVAIYLFGSYAYGTPESGSDLDLLVVVEDDPRNAYDRDAAAYLAVRGIRMPMDLLVYTRKEFEQRAALPVSFERIVRRKGKVIYAA